MITIGVTGGIGSGKSAVTAVLRDFGAAIVDADQVGHQIYQPDAPAYGELVAAFGQRILAPDKTVDRRKLGPIVFADPAALKRLNSIVHPKMLTRMKEMIGEMRAHGERLPIVIEAAILIEANWQSLFNQIWLVTAPRSSILSRLERDRGMKADQTEARIKSQLSDQERRQHASVVIENAGSLDDLRARVRLLWQAAIERGRSQADHA
jgi:dephospho-CoA kinase